MYEAVQEQIFFKKKLSLNQFKFYICELGMLSLFITVLL